MRIALIGPGIMPIPPTSWGAVEILMWDLSLSLKKLGHDVEIFNDKNLQNVADQINAGNFDFVHLHFDNYINFFVEKLNQPFIATMHYGALLSHKFNYGPWNDIFESSFRAPGNLCLSREIETHYLNYQYDGFIAHLRNGVNVNNFNPTLLPPKDAICLGKIERRKRQDYLSMVAKDKVNVDFVGPLGDIRIVESKTTKYIGEWTKPELYNKLSNYKCLLLLSEGEAAPLVVPEALACGLSVIVTEVAAANLDWRKPFIKVVPNNITKYDISPLIDDMIKSNHLYRRDIMNYAKERFDWDVVAKEYIEIAENFIKYCNDKRISVKALATSP